MAYLLPRASSGNAVATAVAARRQSDVSAGVRMAIDRVTVPDQASWAADMDENSPHETSCRQSSFLGPRHHTEPGVRRMAGATSVVAATEPVDERPASSDFVAAPAAEEQADALMDQMG